MSSLPDSDGEDDHVRIGWQPDAAKLRGVRRDVSTAQVRPFRTAPSFADLALTHACWLA